MILHKIFNKVLKYIELNNLLQKKQFDSKILQNKLSCLYHSFTTEVSLPQIINTKNHTKTASSNRVIVNMILRKFFNFCLTLKDFLLIFYHLNALEIKKFVNLH